MITINKEKITVKLIQNARGIVSKALCFYALLFILSYKANAQTNSSYNLNSIPITGTNNCVFGFQSFLSNTTGTHNCSFGYQALRLNTTGVSNSAFGETALWSNTTGYVNTALGIGALMYNTSGSYNTATGANALVFNTTGSYNVSAGLNALSNNRTGDSNVGIGYNSDVAFQNLTNAIAIGSYATVNASNTIQLGNSSITDVFAGTGTNAKLIAGNLQITGGTLAAGKVLTSDNAGNATWQLPSGGGGGFFTNASIGLGNIINTNLGGVIIGTGITSAPAGYKLYVSDGILTEKVKVAIKNSGDWADYVFEKKYSLMPLLEVEAFINKNKHLPGIQSADQLVKEGGIDVGQMMSKQMQKIEELTLYLIQLKKENDEIKAKLTALEN